MADKTRKLLGREFKHATSVNSKANDHDEAIFIKEVEHWDDGTRTSKIRMIKNFERTFYVTRDKFRTHKEKRSWEDLDKLREYRCTQREMPLAIVKALGYGRPSSIKQLNRSPYLYGTDIASTTIIKREYDRKWGEYKSDYKVAHLDIERDVTFGTEAIQMISISCGEEVFQVVTEDYMAGDKEFHEKVKRCYEQEIPVILDDLAKVMEDGKPKFFKGKPHAPFKLIQKTATDEAEAVIMAFDYLHAAKPDILSIWNLPYDLEKMSIALQRKGIAPEDVFCDPKIPAEYRYFRFQEGAARIEDANGEGMNKEPQDRWHRVVCPSHFFWADQMCVRRAIRKHLPKEGSYALGKTLERVFGFGKLKQDNGARSTGIDWHRHMQRHEKVFYCVYNMFDNIGAQLLDEYTLDLKTTFPAQCGWSDMSNYGSQGKKLYDDQYFKLLEKDKHVICGISDQMQNDMDNLLVTLEGWICTLSSHLIDRGMGNRVIKEFPDMLTKIVKWVLDIDVKSSYPSTGVWMNLEQQTIIRQMCKILGVTMDEQRRLGLNLPAGAVNAVNIMRTICNAPSQETMLARFCKARGIKLEY